MATIKTVPNDDSVQAFVSTVPKEETRQDCAALIGMMSKATGCEARMWGGAIIGFGVRTYRYADGKTGKMCLIAFSPRKQYIALYISALVKTNEELLKKLGKYRHSKSCLYVNHLSEVHLPTLKELIRRGAKVGQGE